NPKTLGAGLLGAVASLQRLFARSLRAEWLAGLLVFAITAVLVNLSPSRSAAGSIEAAPPAGAVMSSLAGDLRVSVRLVPAVIGLNSFDVQLGDRSGKPLEDVTQATLRLTPLDADLGEAEVRTEAAHGEPGRFVAVGSTALASEGRWEVRVLAHRSGKEDVDRRFALSITR